MSLLRVEEHLIEILAHRRHLQSRARRAAASRAATMLLQVHFLHPRRVLAVDILRAHNVRVDLGETSGAVPGGEGRERGESLRSLRGVAPFVARARAQRAQHTRGTNLRKAYKRNSSKLLIAESVVRLVLVATPVVLAIGIAASTRTLVVSPAPPLPPPPPPSTTSLM